MRRYLRQILIFFLLSAGVAQAADLPELQVVSVRGNRYFSAQKMIGWSGLKRNKPVSQENLTDAAMNILNKLSAAGYYFCRIDSIQQDYSSDSSLVSVTYHVDEGERLIYGGMEIIGDTLSLDEDFLSLARPGNPLFYTDLGYDLSDVIRNKEEAGHPFARLDIKDLALHHDTLSVAARLTAGPQAYLDKVRIIGLRSTKPNVIARETRIVPGEPYSLSRVQRARQRIRKLPYVESVSVPALVPMGSNRYDLLFQVEEARSNSFDGVVGYQPGADGEEGVVTGLLDLSFLNLFGTGRKAKIHWERASENQQALLLFYEEPWIFGLPINLWGEFSQEILDSLYLERFMAAGATWPALDVLSLKGSIFQEEVLPDSVGELVGIYKSTERGGALELEYDTRDYIDNPIRGIYYRSRAAASIKDYTATSGLENADIRHYETDVSWSYPVIGRQILNLQVHGRFL
ncbi:FtsQ-type POTRA domain-containing protein, partial [bacterium]|nr:FtsQ-type POTRA domain-containing protein [bacterium]